MVTANQSSTEKVAPQELDPSIETQPAPENQQGWSLRNKYLDLTLPQPSTAGASHWPTQAELEGIEAH